MNNDISPTKETNRYHAFISYRHADNKAEGRQWATWLHQALETYEVPKDLVDTQNELGDEIPQRIYPIFRDEAELPADADLSNAISRALDNTQTLIVLCSPRAVESKYVADEIDYFKRRGGSQRIIAVIIDGEPNCSWDTGKQTAGYSPDQECFPVPLQFAYENNEPTNDRSEPIAADFRVVNEGITEEGWTTPQAFRYELKAKGIKKSEIERRASAYEKQHQLMFLKIVAAILSVPLGELTNRDKAYQLEVQQQKARRFKIVAAIFAVVSLFAIVMGGLALFKQTQAEMERDNALEKQSLFLADLSKQKLETHEYETALLLALNALPGIYGGTRPLLPIASARLIEASMKQHKLYSHELERHVTQLVFSVSQAMFATASKDNMVNIWSAETGQRLLEFQHEDHVYHVDFSPDEKLLVSVSDNNIFLWDIVSGALLRKIEYYGAESALFDESGEYLLIANRSKVARLWSIKNNNKITTFRHDQRVRLAKFSTDSTKILTASEDGKANIWSTSTGEKLYEFQHEDEVRQAYLSQDGNLLLTVSGEANVIIRSLKDGTEVYRHSDDYRIINHVALSPDNQSLAITYRGDDELVRVVDTSNIIDKTFSSYRTLEPHHNVIHASFSPDSRFLATASQNGRAILWDADSGVKIAEYRHDYPVMFVTFSATGEFVFTYSNSLSDIVLGAGNIAVWKNNTGKEASTNDIKLAAYALEGQLFAQVRSIEGKDQILIQDRTNDQVQIIDSADGSISDLKFIGKDQLVVSNNTDAILVIDLQTGKTVSELKQSLEVNRVLVDPSKRLLATNLQGGSKIYIWSLKDFQLLYDFDTEQPVEFLQFSPNGHYLLAKHQSLVNHTPMVWDLDEGKRIGGLKHDSEVNWLKFGSGKNELVTATGKISDGRAGFFYWDLSTGNETRFVETSLPYGLGYFDFYEDQQLLLQIGAYSRETVLISDSESFKLIHMLEHSEPVKHAFFNHNGSLVATQTNSAIYIWSTRTGGKLQSIPFKSNSAESPIQKLKRPWFDPLGTWMFAINDEGIYKWEILDSSLTADDAIQSLSLFRRCLTPEERQEYYLSELSDAQWLDRECPQYTQEERQLNQNIVRARHLFTKARHLSKELLHEANISAIDTFSEAKDILETLAIDYPGNLEVQELLASVYELQGAIYLTIGEQEDGLINLRAAELILKKLAEQAIDKLNFAHKLDELSTNIKARQKQYKEFSDDYTRLNEHLKSLKKMLSETPENTDIVKKMAVALNDMGILWLSKGHKAQAINNFQNAQRHYYRLIDQELDIEKNLLLLVRSLDLIAEAYTESYQTINKIKIYEIAIDLLENHKGKTESIAEFNALLANLYQKLGLTFPKDWDSRDKYTSAYAKAYEYRIVNFGTSEEASIEQIRQLIETGELFLGAMVSSGDEGTFGSISDVSEYLISEIENWLDTVNRDVDITLKLMDLYGYYTRGMELESELLVWESAKDRLTRIDDQIPAVKRSLEYVIGRIEPIREKLAPFKISTSLLLGKEVYLSHCSACHLATGLGLPGAFPSIKDSPILEGPIADYINLIVLGVPGTAMHSYKRLLTAKQIASVINYTYSDFTDRSDSIEDIDLVQEALGGQQ